MRTLYFECNMGAAGDMLFGALLELHPDPADFLARINGLGLPEVKVEAKAAQRCGIFGTKIDVSVAGTFEESEDLALDELISPDQHSHGHEHDHHHDHENAHDHAHHHDEDHDHEHHHDHDHDHEHHHDHDHDHSHADHHEHVHEHDHGHPHEHSHDHEHAHHHAHSSLASINEIITGLAVPEKVKADAKAVFELIGQAEARAHRVPIEQIHFHEVGTLDAVVDIVAVCWLINELAVDKIMASPINVGSGQVRCAHGALPVPAPATADILRGVPCYSGLVRAELCTPTGAALLKHFVTEFTQLPMLQISQIGYGLGTKDFAAANLVRAILAETDSPSEQLTEFSCNLDDMSAEELGYAQEQLLAIGALDVWTTPIGMKKSRPAVLLSCLVDDEHKKQILQAIFTHTTTLGVRETTCQRHSLQRVEQSFESSLGKVRIKESTGYGVKRHKIEFADLAQIAKQTGQSMAQIRAQIDSEYLAK